MITEAIILAIVGGVLFAISNVLMRIGVIKSDPTSAIAISTLIGTIAIFFTTLISGEIYTIFSINITSVLYLGTAGFLNFLVARALFFYSSKMIGIARSGPIISSHSIYVVLLGIIFLGEKLSQNEVVAIFLMILGSIFISLSGFRQSIKLREGRFALGLGLAFVSSILLAFAPPLISLGLSDVRPSVGLLISYSTASLGWISILLAKRRKGHLNIDIALLKIFVLQGALTAFAQLSRFSALDIGPVIVVTPIFTSTYPVLTVLFAFLLLRKIEHINLEVWIAVILVVTGAYLVSA